MIFAQIWRANICTENYPVAKIKVFVYPQKKLVDLTGVQQ